MDKKEFLEAVDYIYEKLDEDGSEGRLSQVQDALYHLLLEYKAGLTLYEGFTWKSVFDD